MEPHRGRRGEPAMERLSASAMSLICALPRPRRWCGETPSICAVAEGGACASSRAGRALSRHGQRKKHLHCIGLDPGRNLFEAVAIYGELLVDIEAAGDRLPWLRRRQRLRMAPKSLRRRRSGGTVAGFPGRDGNSPCRGAFLPRRGTLGLAHGVAAPVAGLAFLFGDLGGGLGPRAPFGVRRGGPGCGGVGGLRNCQG